MDLFTFVLPRLLAGIVVSAVLSVTSYAQATRPKNDSGSSAASPYASAFDGYQPFADEKMIDWKTANDTTARIGGWREYAKQAQQPENTPSAATKPGETLPPAKP